MSINQTTNRDSITDGVIITVFEDHGPTNIYNSSPLSDDEAFNMAIKSLTAIGTDTPLGRDELRSYGPMPTPREPYQSIGFLLTLKAESSTDSRIASHGRLVAVWIITKSDTAFSYIGVFKRMIRRIFHIYQIQTDLDIQKEETLAKIDKKLRIVETGMARYYVTKDNNIESFQNLSLVPLNAPIILVDNQNKQINVLFRERPSPKEKMNILQLVNIFKQKIPKGSLFKAELVSDSISINRILAKEGLTAQSDISDHFRIRLSEKLTFDELDDFIELQLTPKRTKLVSLIIQAFETKSSLNLEKLSDQTGFSINMIEEFLQSSIKSNVLQNSRLEDGHLHFYES
ncbi:MAG: hypothetical protein ACFE9L_08550 [Candidatus Hodarchaeota archaeon]